MTMLQSAHSIPSGVYTITNIPRSEIPEDRFDELFERTKSLVSGTNDDRRIYAIEFTTAPYNMTSGVEFNKFMVFMTKHCGHRPNYQMCVKTMINWQKQVRMIISFNEITERKVISGNLVKSSLIADKDCVAIS